MPRKQLYRFEPAKMFQKHVWHTKTFRRWSKCQLLLIGCLLVLPCAEPDVLGAGNAAQDYLSRQQQQSLPFLSDDARHTEERIPVLTNAKESLASMEDQRGTGPGMNGKDTHDKISVTTSDERAELSVKVRQIQLHEGGTHWVELIVEALGPDGKINKAYNGGVAASLILVDEYTKPIDSQQVPLEDSANNGAERAVHLESSLATEGVAVLLFSPPVDGTYRFSISCGGCERTLRTEKRQFAAGTRASLRVTSQPSGAVSGAVLEHQPEAQLEDLDGQPIRIKSTVVANIIPIDLNGKGGTPLASWTVETDELGYARLHGIRVSRAGQHVIQFVATLWQDTRLEVLSAPFEIVPGPAVSAVFSLKPPPRVLLREPFSAVATLVDSEGNETANASKLQRAGDHVEVHLIALNDAGQKVPLHGQTSRVWGGGKLAFEGLWFSEPGRVLLKATCTLCVKDTFDSSANIQAVSASRLQFQPLPLLLERRATQGNEDELPSLEHWGQLKISLKAENWNFGAPQKPVLVEVKSVALLDPLGGLIQEDGAQYLRIEPTSLLFLVEEATDVKTFYLQPLSPGLVVGSKGLSQPGSSINIAAFSVTFDVVSDDPSWLSSTVEFDLPSPALLHGVQPLFFAGPKSLTVYAMDSDTHELLAGFPHQQLVREGEEISYTLRLSARPRENEEITIHISGDEGNSISVKPAMLHFNVNNWRQEQVVVLKVEQDNIAPPANEHPLEGSISGDVIRELALRHDIFSSEEVNVWSMRGGTDVIFSVWDDDIAGVEWGTNPHYLIATEQFSLSFRLRSQPLANVSLQLHCDGTEIISQTKHVYDFEDMPNIDTFDEGEKLGQIFVETAHWQTEHSFILRILSISETHNASLAYSGEGYEVFQSVCNLRASSDDANYNTEWMASSQRHLLAARGFEIPLSINLIHHQDEASHSVGDVAAAAFYSTCVGAHYIRTSTQGIECLPCPPGYECSDPRMPPNPCREGFMSLGGFTTCVPCPEGFACPEGTAVPKQLKPGFYRSTIRSSEVLPTSVNAIKLCPEGFYCTGGSKLPVPCLSGYVSGEGSSECLPCPTGYMCKTSRAADVEPCPKGSYSLRGEVACRLCPAGFACTSFLQPTMMEPENGEITASQQTSNANIKLRQNEGNTLRLATVSDSDHGFLDETVVELLLPCKLGYYSNEGEADCTPCGGAIACPSPSTREHCFTPFTVALPDDPTECVPCPAGYSCQNGILEKCPDFHYSRVGDGLCRLCKGGFLCTGGATAPDEGDLVPIGYYRAEHDAEAYPCPAGTLGLMPGATSHKSCSPCPAGYICKMTDGEGKYLRSSAEPCPAGHICLRDAVACPAHYYQPVQGSTATKCEPCPAGTYTKTTGSASCEICEKWFYCPRGVGPLPCRYSSVESPAGAKRLDQCSRRAGEFVVYKDGEGYKATAYCAEGTVHPDDAKKNTSAANGLFSLEGYGSCMSCPAGYTCEGDLFPDPVPYCGVGYYCPRGSSLRTKIPCPPGTVGDSERTQFYSFCPNCPAGYACSSQGKVSCPAGYYCPEGSWSEYLLPCPAGTVSSTLNASAETSCIATVGGTWSPPGTSIAKLCGYGNYCPEGSKEPIPCPRKTRSTLISGLLNSCVACDASKVCPEGSTKAYSCPTGWYYDSSSDQCIICPLGYTCASGKPVACPTGTYGAFLPQSESRGCESCPQGYYCDTTALISASAKPCTAGFTCPTSGLQRPINKCPAGSYCPLGTALAKGTPCPAGTWSDAEGLVSASQCKPVKAGRFSYEGETRENGSGPCAKGFYCPERSTTSMAVACPPGTYSENEGGASLEDCLPCPGGKDCSTGGTSELRDCPISYYCPAGSSKVIPCPIGTYSDQPGLVSEDQCTKCPPGKFCSMASSSSPSGNCEPGFVCYGGATIATPTDGITGAQCPRGGYCPAGADRVTPCPAGYYNPRAGGGSPSACIECPPGLYCDGTVVSEGGITGPCKEGYYCEAGSATATASEAPKGSYAPEGSSTYLLCNPGTFQNETGSASCLPCLAGTFCQRLGMTEGTECPEASYCPAGSASPKLCPPGTFSNKKNLQSDSECTLCTEGMYCGDYGLKEPSGKCQAGFYCGGGSASSAPQETSGNNQVCPAGHYCPAGSSKPTPCPIGTYSPSKQAISEAMCLPCDPGMTCSETGQSAPKERCPGGSYCPAGGSPTPCTKGHECPDGSAAPTPCKPGTYAATTGLTECKECPEGFFCSDASKEPTDSEKCPAGYFCPKGTASSDENACPQGTFNSEQGATSLDACKPCTAGKYCRDPGSSVESGSIEGGYYSASGAISPKPVAECRLLAAVLGVQTTPCPGFEAPISTLSEAASTCLKSEDCQGVVETTESTFFLRCGDYSRSSTEKENFFYPKHCTIAGICEPGTYCPEGSTEPKTCPQGQYCAAYGLASPSGNCEAGYLCPEGSSSPHPVSALCTPGHYCPENATAAQPCPRGKILSGSGGSSDKDCLPCPAGFFCDKEGLSDPAGPCPEGKFCPEGTASPDDATECTAGHMCPEGSASPMLCPQGTKQPSTGQANCIKCTVGEICGGGSVEGLECPAGFTCPEGTVVQTSFPCPVGTYSKEANNCLTCPEGFYCDTPGATAPAGKCKPGYYCPPGTMWQEPTTFCKHGQFCPPGSKAPQDCPANHFCNTVKLGEPSGPCRGGFICSARCTTPKPTQEQNGSACDENMTGRPCSKGHYCPRPESPLVAGTGFPGSGGDGLPGPETLLMLPTNAVMDSSTGDIYIADYGNYAVKVVYGNTGNVETLVSASSVSGTLSWIRTFGPVGVAFCSTTKKLYISYPGRNAILEHDVSSRSSKLVSEVSTDLSKPLGLETDEDCNSLYIADSANHRVLKYAFGATPAITTVIGTGAPGKSDSSATATTFQIDSPSAVALNGDILYVVDSGNKRVLAVNLVDQSVEIFDGSAADSSIVFERPVSAAIAQTEDGEVLVVADAASRALRKIDLQTKTAALLVDYTAWRSFVVEEAETSIAATGLEHAFYGVSSFFGKDKKRTGVLLADSYSHRIRRVELETDLYSIPPVTEVPCPVGTYLPYTGAASEDDCMKCPFGMYCSAKGLTEPEGPCNEGYYCPQGSTSPTQEKCQAGNFCSSHSGSITIVTTRSRTSRPPLLRDATTDLERSDNAERGVSGWFRRLPSSAHCNKSTRRRTRFAEGQEEEDIFLIDLDEPKDLLGIDIQLEGNQSAAALLGVDIRQEKTCFTACGSGRPAWSRMHAFTSGKTRIPFRNRAQQAIRVSSNAEDLKGIKSILLRFAAGTQPARASVSLATTETRGPVAQKQCPPGTYQPNEGATGCEACPAGSYCDEFGLAKAKECPAGFLCPEGSITGKSHYCKIGSISTQAGASTEESCVPCEASKFCGEIGAIKETGECAAGYYCKAGSWTATPVVGIVHPDTGKVSDIGDICPKNHYCPAGSSTPTPCPAGTFSQTSGVTSLDGCFKCSPGFACISEGVQVPCGEGYVCLEGSNTTTPTDNVMGYACPAGSYCTEGSFAEKLCPAGTFSLQGQASCTPCSAGKYCFDPGNSNDGQPCPAGHYCGEQTIVPQPCPPGTFQDKTGQTSCKPCSRGKYCPSYRATGPAGNCYEGTLCVEGATHPRVTDRVYSFEDEVNGLCPAGHFCKEGALKPEPCPEGEYQDKAGAKSCIKCPEGKYCAGTGNTAPTGNCAPGYVCYKGSTSREPQDGTTGAICPKGMFCEEGATHPTPCAPGTYTNASGQHTCLPCPEGFYCDKAGEDPKKCPEKKVCAEGSARPGLCPLGSIPNTKADAVDVCVPCPQGKYCRGAVVAGDCLPGFFCGLGNWVPNPWMEQAQNEPFVPESAIAAGGVTLLTLENWETVKTTGYGGIPCPAGHYCPAGASEPKPCPTGSVRQETLGRWEADCSLCPRGYYCPDLSLVPEPCPAGHFCPLGSLAPRPCVGGTYNPHIEGSSTSSCLTCLPGYLCPGEGNEELAVENQCPTGHYCLEGSQQGIPCPPGTYGDLPGLSSEDGCKACPAGKFCPVEGLSEPGDVCPEGHYCPSGTAVPRKCLQGTWCPEASGEPQQCPPGAICPAGSAIPQQCPQGSYCPHDQSFPVACPAGYKGSDDRSDTSSLETGCSLCPPGTYSSEPGMTECTMCTPGYVCLAGCSSSMPTDKDRDKGYRCTPGTYCPEGSSSEQMCPVGTYGLQTAATGIDACAPCPLGTYNDLEGQTGCVLCGATATSNSNSTSCTCKGTNRAFQLADRSCVCLSGFHYKQGNADLSDQDGVEPCQQTLYHHCNADSSRDATGACVSPERVCSDQCGPAGGSFSTISGLCSCSGEKSLDEVCDEACRETRPQLILKESTLIVDNPETSDGDKEFDLEDLIEHTGLATGSYDCTETQGCTVRMFDTTLAKMTGLVGVPQSFVDELTERLQDYGIVPEAPDSNASQTIKTRRLSGAVDFGYFGVSDPIQCLPLGSTVAWHIRPSPNPIYPVYLRNNLLNTNKQFDYGAFRDLDTDMKGGEQRVLFIFTFKEPGLYVFGLNTDPNKFMVLRVMEARRLCRDSALLPQLRTAETLAAVAARLPSTVETAAWTLFVIVVVGIIVVAVLVFLAAWTFKHQRLESLEADPKSKYNQPPPKHTSEKDERAEVEELVLQTQAKVPLEEDPGVLRARRALAKKLETQDPRLFVAVLNLTKQIKQDAEERCTRIVAERSEGLSQLLDLTRKLRQELADQLHDAAASEIWSKENDEEREEILSTLLSLLRLRRRDLVNKLALAEKEHEEEAALKEKEEQLLLLRSRNDSLISSTILPAVGEKRQVQMSSIKLSVEAQIEGLLEEFRKARADADDDMPSIIELYKAKMKTIFEEAQGETKLAFRNMLSADIEERLMTGSLQLDLNEAKNNLRACEDDADERKALGAYRTLAGAAWKLTIFTTVIEQEIAAATQAVNKAVSEAKEAVEVNKTSPAEAADSLKAAVVSCLKDGRSRIQEAGEEAEQAIASAEAQALSQCQSWGDDYESTLRDMYDALIEAQSNAINSTFATETRLLTTSMQTTKNQILEQTRNRYSKIDALRCSTTLEELQVILDASISEISRKTRQQLIDDAVRKVSNEVNHLRDEELESTASTLSRIIATRTECFHKRQSAFKSRKLLMLQWQQEFAAQYVSMQAQAAVALLRRGLRILSDQLKAAKTYEGTVFAGVANYGVDMATFIKENKKDISELAALQEGLRAQQSAALTKLRQQLLACLRNQRKAASDELWDLEQRERNRIGEDLEEQTTQLQEACTKLDEAIAKEEAARDEYDKAILNMRQENQRGMMQLDAIQSLSDFKQKLLSKINVSFLSQAEEARSKGIDDPNVDEKLLQEWKNATAELEPFINREKEVFRRYTDSASKIQKENALRSFEESRESRRNQAALTRSLEQAEEEGDEELRRKRYALGTREVQRIVWHICALLSSGKRGSSEVEGLHLIVPEDKIEETVNELQQQLRRRRQSHLEYCLAQRSITEGTSKTELAILQTESLLGPSDLTDTTEGISRGSAMVNAADASGAILEVIKEAQKKLDEALDEIQKEQEEAEERERVEHEEEISRRRMAHELAKQKLNEEHAAKLAEAPEDIREQLIKEHEAALSQMEAALQSDLEAQEKETQRRLEERRQRLQKKRKQAEEEKQKAIDAAKAELEAKIAAEAKQKEDAAELEEMQRLINESTNAAAVAELLARKHNKESSALLQELSLKKAEAISALTENFWKEKGGRTVDGRPDDVQGLYKAELQEKLLTETQAMDDRIRLQLQELQHRQVTELDESMKQMECRAKLKRENEAQRLSEEEQYAQLKKEADAAAAEEVGAIEERMKEEQEKILKEMEAKRNAYDKMLDKLKHRKELEERREALRQDQQQRLKAEGKGGGLQSLMEQYEEHRKLLEEALAEEAERQHKKARERTLLRQVERTERLHQKRVVEKQRFLLNQEEIKRQELALNNARAGAQSRRNLVETLNQQELKRRMEFAHRLEEEKHWAPIWREIVEEEQNAGTFDAWDLDDEQVTFAGQFATNLLHTERMLQSEASYMRKLIGGFQQLSDVISLIKAAPEDGEEDGQKRGSSKSSSSSGSSSSSSSSSAAESSESTESDNSGSSSEESSSESESDDSESDSEEASSSSSSEEESSSPAASSSSDEASSSPDSSSSSSSSSGGSSDNSSKDESSSSSEDESS